ncbi:MAG TPA: glycosyltransferase family 39 protein [Gaiellaceae bacterium]|nr:glycosyltransferase family 39 protein [Gaiellaceae bacterium]
MSVQTPERTAAVRRADAVSRHASRSRLWPVALAGLFAVAALYHWFQSLGHVTPAVFTDELMFAELARSVAGGDGLTVRGADFAFPAILPVLVQAPVWLLDGTAYGAAKALNAVVMCLAVFPAWALARQLVRPAYALGVAAATVAGGGMLYHSYLTSEALAFPVFLLAVAVSVRAIGEESRRWDALAVLVLGVAVLTRAQFVVLPVAFALTVLLVGRPLRRHTLALSALGVVTVAALVAGSSQLGFYGGARELDYPALETLRWAGWTAALLPFAAGVLVVPGAILGFGHAIAEPRKRAEPAFAVMSVILVAALAVEAGLIASGEAHRPMERYVFYAVPLLFAAFFIYLERGAPSRRLYAGVALALGGLALAVPFASLAVEPFSFDSPTLSAVEDLGRRLSPGDAAALFGALGLVAALVAAAVPLRRLGPAVAALSIVLMLAVGVAAYSGDRRMTRRAAEALAPAQQDWLDRLGVDADVLVLPGGSLHAGWMLESWNRRAGATYHLGDVDDDPLPHSDVSIGRDGSVTAAGGAPVRSRHLVVVESGSRIEFAGRRVARPMPGLGLYRTNGALRVRSLANGLYSDGWARAVLSYAVWPKGATRGEYHVRLELPKGRAARTVELEAGRARRTARLGQGAPLDLRVPAAGTPIPPLSIRIDRADLIGAETPRPRLVGARVTALRFVPETGSRNR